MVRMVPIIVMVKIVCLKIITNKDNNYNAHVY